MDLKNFYRKIDVDNIKTKLPPMPQLKLPKVKSRKIFKSSREDVSSPSPKQQQQQQRASLAPPPIKPSKFVDHTPTRISTVSSLMNIDEVGGGGGASGSNVGCYGRGGHWGSNDYSYGQGFNSPQSFHGISSRGRRGMDDDDEDEDDDDDGEDEDYRNPSGRRDFSTLHRQTTIELDRAENGGGGASSIGSGTKMSFGEKCKKHYRDISSFKLKHLFAKKTVVRKTDIEVDHYAHCYERERYQQQQREQIELENMSEPDYEFDFKMARRRMSCNSNSISPPDSLVSGVPSPVRSDVARLQGLSPPRMSARAPSVKRKFAPSVPRSGSESSGSKDAPPPPPPGHKTTRLGIRRGAIAEDIYDEGEEDIYPSTKANRSTLWSIKENVTAAATATTQVGDANGEQEQQRPPKKSYKESIRKFKTMMSREATVVDTPPENNHPEAAWKPPSSKAHRTKAAGLKSQTTNDETATDDEKKLPASSGWNLRTLTRRHATQAEGQEHSPPPPDHHQDEGRFPALKAGIKRFKPNNQTKRKRQNSIDETDEERTSSPQPAASKSTSIAARLRRFKSREASMDEVDSPQAASGEKSDLTTKLQNWKKSFKTKSTPQNEMSTGTGDEASPPDNNRRGTLIKKLRYIRSRKSPPETANEDTDGGETVTNKKPSKLENAREKAFKKVNAQMQRMKFFQKSQQAGHGNDDDDYDDDGTAGARNDGNVVTDIVRSQGFHRNYALDPDEDYYNQQMLEALPKASRTLWTTNRILSESLESDDLPELPRVLIHQDNSDCFESTLIIAVTRAAPPAAPSATITELPPSASASSSKGNNEESDNEWNSTQASCSSRYLDMTPMAAATTSRPSSIGHNRKRSMDSNDSDSWIPNNFRNKVSGGGVASNSSSAVGLNSADETNKPWKVHSMFSEKILYKTKSVDIFVANDDREVFADFDDELRNVPVMRVIANSADSFERSFGESTDDDDNYDSASRITKIMVPPAALSGSDKADSEDSTEARHGSPGLKPEKHAAPAAAAAAGSRDSLDANYDESEVNIDGDDDDDGDDSEEDDRPPSAAPSPPPTFSPPPPPLPLRRPSTGPPPRPGPPKVPERNESMVRLTKPLVKQASLRRNFSEEMPPGDFGKVNKLISRFEQPPPPPVASQPTRAPRHRRMRACDESDTSGDDDDDDDDDEDEDDDDIDNEDDDDIQCRRGATNVNHHGRRQQHHHSDGGEITPTPDQRQSRTISVEDSSTSATTSVIPKKRMAPIPVPASVPMPNREQAPVVRVTPTSTPTPTTTKAPPQVHRSNSKNNNDPKDDSNNNNNTIISKDDLLTIPILIPLAALDLESNSSRSQASSEYGSPLGYPASLRGSACATPTPSSAGDTGNITYCKHVRGGGDDISRRLSNRSSLRGDDDTFYSFESDEENNFYSLGETTSSGGGGGGSSGGGRLVIEI